MAVGNLVRGAQMVDWYNRLNAIRGAVGIGSAGMVNPTGSYASASHINNLVNAITSTYFGSNKLLTFAAAPIVTHVSVGQIIAWDTAFRIDFTLNNMNTAASFGTQGTLSTFNQCGHNATNWVFADTCFTFRSQKTTICGTASQTNCKTTY